MADDKTPEPTANPLPPYPMLSTMSDKPTPATAAPKAPPALAGQSPDPEPVAATAEDAVAAADPKPAADAKPEPTADPPAVDPPKRGRPSKADRELSELRAAMVKMTETIEALRTPPTKDKDPAPEPKPVAAKPRPKRADFDDPDAYDEALDAWHDERTERAAQLAVTKAQTERAAREAEKAADDTLKAQKADNDRVVAEWNEKRSAALDRYDDYAEVAESAETPMTMPMLHAIVNSEVGPDIAYWLGKNQKEAARIAAIASPIRQALEIGRIEAKLPADEIEAKPDPKPEPKPKAPDPDPEPEPAAAVPQRSAAPRPIRPVTPRSEPVDEAPTEANSEARIGRMLDEMRKGNSALGWGPGSGRVN